MKIRVRESNFELLRLLCMISIVFYHLFLFRGNEISNEHWLFKASTIVFHFGVVVFVLISGWFSIKLSWKRILTIYVPLIIYTISIDVISGSSLSGGVILLNDESPLWFIQPYIQLCLLSPFINRLLSGFDKYDYLSLLSVVGLILFYWGYILGCSFANSQSLTLFCFLYVLGRMLRMYFYYSAFKCRKKILFGIFVISIMIYLLKYSGANLLAKFAGGFYAYNSPCMIIYSVLILLFFSSLKFHSRFINYIAASSFSIYVIGSNPFIIRNTYDYVDYIVLNNHIVLAIFLLFILSIIICFACIIIDIILRPIISLIILSLSNVLNNICSYERLHHNKSKD